MAICRYPVEKQWIPGLPNNPYRKGVGAYEGVVLHFTANYASTIDGEVAYMTKNWANAFVHEFVSAEKIVQTANPEYKCWGCGPVGNPRFVQLELCVAHSKEEFEKSFDAWCERAAEYLAARKLGVSPANADGSGTLWSHKDVSQFLGGTDHTDPIGYLGEWGYTWQNVLDRVALYYGELTKQQAVAEYVVKAGDTLGEIAHNNGKTLEQVLAMNPEITNPAMIHSGQTIRLIAEPPTPEPVPEPKLEPIPEPTPDPAEVAPEWARVAVKKAMAKGVLHDPNGSQDFYRILTILERLGLLG